MSQLEKFKGRQWKTRQHALRALGKLTSLRLEKTSEEEVSPGELWLLRRLKFLSSPRDEWGHGRNVDKNRREIRNMKSIARCLNLWPIPRWALDTIEILERVEGKKEMNVGHEIGDTTDYYTYSRVPSTLGPFDLP